MLRFILMSLLLTQEYSQGGHVQNHNLYKEKAICTIN